MEKREQENKTSVSEAIRELSPEDLSKVSAAGQPQVFPKSEEKDR